jgi:hypothetical protein
VGRKTGGVTGARLVGQVFDRWSHLPDYHFRALARMALRALDDPAPPVPAATYWGGRECIARTFPQPFPEGESPDEVKRLGSVLNTVTVVCRELRAEGAIEIVKGYRPPGPGNRQVFRLTLDNEPTGAIARFREQELAARRIRRKVA